MYILMYADTDFAALTTEAEQFILENDRMLYLPFFKTAELYIRDHEMVIGGRVGIDLLTEKPYSKDSFMWELYCDNAYHTSVGLADALAHTRSPHIPPHVALRTDIKHRELTIMVNTRMLFKIYGMDMYRGVRLIKLMNLRTMPGYFSGPPLPLLCMSAEMCLIDVYRRLYTPAEFVAHFQEDIIIEQKLYDMVVAEGITGGGPAGQYYDKAKNNTLILRKLAASPMINNMAVVGDFAMPGPVKPEYRLQLIYNGDIDQLTAMMDKILAQYGKTIFVRYQLNIPSDFQIIKYTLYLKAKDKMPIMDVFNSASFEMIPYWHGATLRIGNPMVVLRFLLIDIWTARLVSGMKGGLNMNAKISELKGKFATMRKLAQEILKSDPRRIFQSKDYIGRYINPTVAKRNLIKQAGLRIPIYYPELLEKGE
jgi:hypothetical protein